MTPIIVEQPRAADRFYERCSPIAPGDEEAGWLLYALCESLTSPMEPLEDIFRGDEQSGPFVRAVSVDNAPLWCLPWLGCIVGVPWRSPPTEHLRHLIRTRPHQKRGTVPAIRAAMEDTLTGSRRTMIVPRYTGSMWRLLTVSYTPETPDPAATLAAILAEKPAGVVLTYRVDTGWSVGELEAEYGLGTIGELETDFADLHALETRLP